MAYQDDVHMNEYTGTSYTFKKKLAIAVALLCTGVLLFILLRIIFDHPKKAKHVKATQVLAAKATTQDVPVYLKALGQVTPLDTVTVITQVNGILKNVYFKEGQMVKKGDLLARIDESPFIALVKEFEGQLERDLAQLKNARVDLNRYEQLWKADSVAKQVLDTQVALVNQLEGTVKADQGLLDNARVNLNFCKITSPIQGRVGLRLIDPGNFVQTSNTTGLFVINTVQPVTVVFTLPEDNIPQVLKKVKAKTKLVAEAFNRTQSNLLSKGTLLTLDNQINPTTGTVKLKAQFDNKDEGLFPNQFVNVQLRIDTLKQAILIPNRAVLHGVKRGLCLCLKT